eukprot:6211860-Pleurochrysis_carterae.AAC.2
MSYIRKAHMNPDGVSAYAGKPMGTYGRPTGSYETPIRASTTHSCKLPSNAMFSLRVWIDNTSQA